MHIAFSFEWGKRSSPFGTHHQESPKERALIYARDYGEVRTVEQVLEDADKYKEYLASE